METNSRSKRIMGIAGIVIAIALALALGSLSFSFLGSAHATGENAVATQEESQVNDLAAPGDSAAATDDAATDAAEVDETAVQEEADEPEDEQPAPAEDEASDDGGASDDSDDSESAESDLPEEAVVVSETDLPEGLTSGLSTFADKSAGDLVGENLVSSISDIILNSSGEEMYKTTVAVLDKNAESDNSYLYKTGQEAQYFIAISNQDNIAMQNVVRVYFAYDGAQQDMGSFLGGKEYNLLNSSTGTTYPMKVVETDVPNVFYYEITGILPGETLGFSNSVLYPSPNTPGGTLRVWTNSLSIDDAAANEGKVITPIGDYMELTWDTEPVLYGITKSNTTVRENSSSSAKSLSPTVQASATEPGVGVVKNLAWNITEKNTSGSPNRSEGLDYVLKGTYEDVIDLPEELSWRPEILEVVENGPKLTTSADQNNASLDGWWNVSTSIQSDTTGSTTANTIRVRKDGVTYDLAYIYKKSSSNSTGITEFTPHVVTVDGEKKIQLTWYLKNSALRPDSTNPTYADAEYGTQGFYLRTGDNAILADLDKINEAYTEDPGSLASLIKVKNDVEVTRDYSYSPDRTSSSSVERVVGVQTGWNVTKEWKNNPYSRRYVVGGTDDFTVVKINNTGILNIAQWGKQAKDEEGQPIAGATDGVVMTDSLDKCYFITPANIVEMLNESVTAGRGNNSQKVPVGDWLTITISNASLFTPGAYQPSDGEDQSGKYNASGTIAATDDANCRAYEKATISITKNAEGKIEVKLSGDPTAENNKTYTVDNAAGLTDLFTQIGYFPTRNTVYSAKYQLGEDEDFTLYPGQELDLTLRSTTKTTPMMLTRDAESYCPENDVTMNNTANVNALVSGQYVTEKPSAYHGYYHYWDREMSLYKYGYIENGSSISNNGKINDGTVMDTQITGSSSGSISYDRMQFADHLTGAQVLLVPVDKNPSLTAPDGSALERFESAGKSYWLLNKPGTYHNVIVGGTSRTGAATFNTETITVQLNGSGTTGSLDTIVQWNPIQPWNKNTSIWYKVLVSAHKAGLISSQEAAAGKEYKLMNRAWMSDHQGHRLYDAYGLTYDVFRHDKSIVDPFTGKGDGTDSKANGTLVTESRVTNGETVTYELDVQNVTEVPVLITGDMMRDRLPYGYEVIDWDTSNVGNLRYYAPEGSTIKAGSTSIGINGESTEGISHWSIRKTTEGSGSNAKTVHDLMWNNDFQVSLAAHGTLKIMVDVTFPARPDEGESLWDQYVNASKGAYIYNTFYFNSVPMQVRHTLEAEGRPVLYKGVYDTGLTTHGGSSDKWLGSYYSNKSRIRYVNGGGTVSWDDADLKAETVTYYTVLYNGSYDRLYLEDMQDQLPRGFTFNSFCNTSATTSYIRYYNTSYSRRGNTTDKSSTSYSQNFLGYTGNNTYLGASSSYTVYQTFTEGYSSYSSSDKLVTISNKDSAVDNNTIKYVNAKVTATPSFNSEDGRQHLTFKVSNAAQGNGQAAVHYDSKVGKYYLNPGEAIRFGYNCLVGKHSDTDDLATNTVAMPYYDYYGIGFDLHAPSEEDGGAVQKARSTGTTENDGGCELYTDEAVAEKYHMNTAPYQDEAYKSKEEGNWLVSDVTLERAPITPGMVKNVGGVTPADQDPVASTVQGSLGDSVSLNGGKSTQFGNNYVGAAKSSDIINWRLRVYNESGGINDEIPGMLSDFQVVDTVAEPYAFTGRVFYNMYNKNGTRGTSSTQFLFTIGNRTDGQTSVRVAAGTSPTNNNGRNITIGSAEDDSDDDWFQFGTGSKEGYVKIEKNEDGQEVMTIRMVGASYSVPGGNYMQLAVHTQYTKDQVVISDLKYNDVVLYPAQDYDSERVVNGRARTKQGFDPRTGQVVEENDGVQSGASVVLNQGFTTSAHKEVTQTGKPSNTASSESTLNYISLDEKHDTFRYDLHVNGPESNMSKIVVIDDLPQEGDHSSFVEADKRNSDFTVSFLADNPQITVAIAPKNGAEKQLTENYRLYVNSKTEFNKDDWRGEGEGWVDITDMTGDELKAQLEDARSIRVVVEDPEGYVQKAESAYMMPKECKIHIGFNAKIDDPEATAGEYAWNSFGYRYTVPLTHFGTEENSADVDLEAQPLNVGVRYPAAPSLEKRLVVLEQKLEPKTEQVEVTKDMPVLDDEGNPVLDEDGNPVTTPVTELETRVVTEDVPRPVYDPTTGEPVLDEDGNPVTEMVPEPVMVPVYDENGNAVMELKEHPANEDLDFGFIVYKGKPISALDDAANMTVEDIVAAIEGDSRDYIYVPLTVKAGDSSVKTSLQNVEYRSVYNHETGEFSDDDADGVSWRWENLGEYTVVELPMGDYFYTLYSVQTGAAVSMQNNAVFTNGNTRVLSLAVTNEWAPEYIDVSGTKVWNDNDNQDGMRPDSVTVHLLADGEEIDSAEVGADDDWSFLFEHLLKYRENGDLIQYQVVEDAVDGYSVTYEMTEVVGETEGMVVEDPTTGDNPDDTGTTGEDDGAGAADDPGATTEPGTGEGGDQGDDGDDSGDVIEPETTVVAYNFTVTNTHTPFKTSVSVAKVWDGDSAGDRPGSVTMHLLANGEDTGQTLELSGQNNWQGAFTELDQNSLGEPIEYTVTEDAVDGYTSEVTGNQAGGYVVTNTFVPSEEAAEDKLPPTGDELPTFALVGMLLAVASLGGIFAARRRMNG